MIEWGITAMTHDAAIAVFDDGQLIWASQSERFSRIKGDKDLHPDLIKEALEYGSPEQLYFYEDTNKKKIRQAFAKQWSLLTKDHPEKYMRSLGIPAPIVMVDHHHSHAAMGLTCIHATYEPADILVIDSIGEFDTTSIWKSAHGVDLTKMWSQTYPHSIGLWYSAMTQRIGLKPQEHEYILMGMAPLGDRDRLYGAMIEDFFVGPFDGNQFNINLKINLHRGCLSWRPDLTTVQDYADIAAATQRIYEEIFENTVAKIAAHSDAKNLIVAGGCALNCVANTLAYKYYDRVYISSNPGDAGSAIGCVLAHNPEYMVGRALFMGHTIEGRYPIDKVIDDLLTTGISAVASGPAEFGPRALGNRSILADPRIPDIKDRINKLKQREDFRPFAPMVMSEYLNQYFKVPSPHFQADAMQFAIPMKNPDRFPGICHVDGTSRVQTVKKHMFTLSDQRHLLERWYDKTKCPMLLNTSLNVKGEPMVNTRADAERWTKIHGLEVRMPEEKK